MLILTTPVYVTATEIKKGSTAKITKKSNIDLGKTTKAGSWEKELKRDKSLPVTTLKKPTNYTKYAEKKKDLEGDIAPNRHFTGHNTPGRPAGAQSAKEKFGLSYTPKFKTTYRLPKGFKVREEVSATGGTGKEMTSPLAVPKEYRTSDIQAVH